MTLILKKATLAELNKLYHDFIIPYFPENEVKPMSHIERMMMDGLYQILVGYDEEGSSAIGKEREPVAAAFITTAPGAESYLLDYLAVKEDGRSMGYGGQMLAHLTGLTNGKPILIETEAVDFAENEKERIQRIKRNSFYSRNGAVPSELITKIFGVVYINWELSDRKKKFSTEEIQREIDIIYHYMVEDELYDKFVRIPNSL